MNIPKLNARQLHNGPKSFGFDSEYMYLELGWSWARKNDKTPFAIELESTIDDGSCFFHALMKQCGKSSFRVIKRGGCAATDKCSNRHSISLFDHVISRNRY